eukprot:COSAG04_NODE_1323_length_7222_cov_14.445178_3_plen_614_part_00
MPGTTVTTVGGKTTVCVPNLSGFGLSGFGALGTTHVLTSCVGCRTTVNPGGSRTTTVVQSPAGAQVATEGSACSSAGGLDGNASVLSAEELAFAQSMVKAGQAHLFTGWPAPGTQDEEKKGLIAQLQESDKLYGGGIAQYVENAKALLAASKAGENPLEGYSPVVPSGMTLTAHTDEWAEVESAGLEMIGKCAFMLVAGGLGERLGYGGIKIALPTETASEKCYLKHYIETILSYQTHARAATGDASIELPLAIMTSADTDGRTRELLAANDNFGMAEGQVTLLKQGKVPSIEDNEGRIALDDSGFRVQTKPHGHGDVHSLLHLSGTVKKWLGDGLTHMYIFQDTNAFALRSCLLGLGVCKSSDFDMNSLCVPRIAGEAIGGICALRGEGKPDLTINVEYNQIDAMLRATEEFKDGDVNDPATGFSTWPGNINELIFKLSSYDAALEQSGGQVPEFVNPKYADAEKTVFKSPTRLECMMQDFPRLYKGAEKVGFTSLNRPAVRQYSPVKNNVGDAAKKQASGLEPACAAAGEFDVYRFNCDYLLRGETMAPCPAAVAASAASVAERSAMVRFTALTHPFCLLSPDGLLQRKDGKTSVVLCSAGFAAVERAMHR